MTCVLDVRLISRTRRTGPRPAAMGACDHARLSAPAPGKPQLRVTWTAGRVSVCEGSPPCHGTGGPRPPACTLRTRPLESRNPVSDAALADIPEGALLLTGAPGLVGMDVLARFLERSDDHVVALVRADDDEHAAARVRATLEGACLDAGAPADRVTALAGDLTAPRLGLGDRWGELARRIGAIVHGAASVAFDLSLEESRHINVDGTRQMLELARACQRLRRFTYVSTAYVAGDRRGTVYEDDPGGGRFRNAYERTKHEAERLVAACRDEMEVTIVRPSIVVGDPRTGWTAAFNVLYTPLRAFEAGVIPVVPARRRSPVDVVPVDYVADAVHALAEAPEAAGQTFHVVAGERASTVGEIGDMAGGRVSVAQPPNGA